MALQNDLYLTFGVRLGKSRMKNLNAATSWLLDLYLGNKY